MRENILSSIQVAQYQIEFAFESEDTISAFSRIVFINDIGRTISTFVVGDDAVITIPSGNFIGRRLEDVKIGPGLLRMEFGNAGAIEVTRVANEIEVALLLLGGTVRAVT